MEDTYSINTPITFLLTPSNRFYVVFGFSQLVDDIVKREYHTLEMALYTVGQRCSV